MNPLKLSVIIVTVIMIVSFLFAINRQDRFGDWLMSCVFTPCVVALVALLFLGLLANN